MAAAMLNVEKAGGGGNVKSLPGFEKSFRFIMFSSGNLAPAGQLVFLRPVYGPAIQKELLGMKTYCEPFRVKGSLPSPGILPSIAEKPAIKDSGA